MEVGTRALLAVVFAAALFGKVSGRASWSAFVQSLRQMGLVPSGAVRPAAAATVVAESAAVLLLVVPGRWSGAAGFVVAGVLLAVFTGAVALTIRRDRQTPCRCFGASDTLLGRQHVVRNAALTGTALLGLVASTSAGELHLAAALLAVLGGALAGTLVAVLDDLVALYRSPV
ncbi:MauE/DoxX family redox-associated membrane protein [Micromonospora sp. NPDC023888]|uniref:MauE/DoxX family redox-associated membrane protein n=1 Tax=Micromonospora sp. NPDC023888 TaxID=3155607 RepID=UPI0033C8CC73